MKVIAVTKLENDQQEVGVQVRDGFPTSDIDNRIYIEKASGKFVGYFSGQKYVFNVNVLEEDPTNPSSNECWINSKTGTFKYMVGGVVKTIATSISESSENNLFDYFGTLTSVELKTLAPTSIPNYMIDDFSAVYGALTNTTVTNSSLMVSPGQTEGNYQMEKRAISGVNHAEGVIVHTAQALAPFALADNGDGTHTAKFKGDVTGYLSVGKKCFIFEEEVLAENKKRSYYLQDADLRPAMVPVVSVAYDNVLGETTVVFTDLDLDLAMGFVGANIRTKIRIFPFGVVIKAGGNGLAGTLEELVIEEAISVESALRVLGDDTMNYLKANIPQEKVLAMWANHSPNKQNWLIFARIAKSFGTSVVKMWYSTDGLKTITMHDNFQHVSEYPATERANAEAIYGLYDGWNTETLKRTLIHNDGRFAFGVRYWAITNCFAEQIYFGVMNSTEFKVVRPQGFYHAAGQGAVNFDHTTLGNRSAGWSIDWATGLLVCPVVRTDSNGYVQLWRLDFTNLLGFTRGYYKIHATAVTMYNDCPAHSEVVQAEGETMILVMVRHTNLHMYMYKISIATHMSLVADGNVSQIGVLAGANPAGGYGYAFGTPAVGEGGTRFVGDGYQHELNTTYCHDYAITANNELIASFIDPDNNQQCFSVLDLGRTRKGIRPRYTLTFSAVPDSGSFTISITQVTGSITQTTSALAYSSTVAQIKTALEALTSIGAGNATVTGSYATGIVIEIAKEETFQPMVIATNTMTAVSVAVVITVTQNAAGLKPIWISYDNQAVKSGVYNPAKGHAVVLQNDLSPYETIDGINRDLMHMMESKRGQVLQVRGNSLLMTKTLYDVGAASPYINAELWKVPNFKESYGQIMVQNGGTFINDFGVIANNNVTPLATKATAFGNIITVPAVPFSGTFYADAKIPCRTLTISLQKNWYLTTELIAKFGFDAYVQIKVCNVVGGLPDESSVLGTSLTRVPLAMIPARMNAAVSDQFPFIFNNLKLTPASQVAIIVEVVGYNVETASGQFGISVGGSATAGGGVKKFNGIWATHTGQMWFNMLDFYRIPLDKHLGGTFAREVASELQLKKDNVQTERMGVAHTLYPIGTSTTDRMFNAQFKTTKPNIVDSTTYSPATLTQQWQYKIDDTAGEQLPPTLSAVGLLGQPNEITDKFLRFAFIPGQKDETCLFDSFGKVWTQNANDDDRIYNATSHVGGCQMTSVTGVDGKRLKRLSGQTYGIAEDTDFKYGMCKEGADAWRMNTPYASYNPNMLDFAIEFEVKMTQTDINSVTPWSIMRGHFVFEVFIASGKYRFDVLAFPFGAGTTTYNFKTLEDVPANTYHKVRITRDPINGLQIFRNFSKDGGTWVKLTLDSSQNATLQDLKNDVMIGHQAGQSQNYLSICETAAFTSKIGYIKYSIGSSTFTYDGIYYSKPIVKSFNFGEVSIAMKQRYGNGFSTFSNGYQGIFGGSDLVVIKDGVETALVATNDQVFKFKKAIPQGSKMATRIDLKKEGANDINIVQGYLINFERK